MTSSGPLPDRTCQSGWVMGVTEQQQMTNETLFHEAYSEEWSQRERDDNIHDNKEESTGHCIKWNKPDEKETSVSRPYSRVIIIIIIKDAISWKSRVTGLRKVEEDRREDTERSWWVGTRFQLGIHAGALTQCRVATVNTTALFPNSQRTKIWIVSPRKTVSIYQILWLYYW